MRTVHALTTRPGGRVLNGLLQALALWVIALVVVPFVRHFALLWASLSVALLSSLLLGQGYRRHARRDTAIGVFTGAALWPVVIGASVIAINIVSTARSDVE